MNITAIVVTYNGRHWLDRCLGNLRSSTTPVHTIVVDNGSTDGTCDHIRAHFPEVELIQAERNLGFGQANNRGMRLALDRGADHVFLLNQDAWVLPDTIAQLMEAAATHPGLGVISPLHLNGAGDRLDYNFSCAIIPQRCPDLYSDLALGRSAGRVYAAEFVNAAAWSVSAHCLRTVGGFDPTFFHYGEDDNYVARMKFHGLGLAVLPDARIHHDREQRTEDPRYMNDRAWRLRMLRLRYADPASDLDPAVEEACLKRNMWTLLLKGRIADARVARDHFKLHQEAGLTEVAKNRAVARGVGPSFL